MLHNELEVMNDVIPYHGYLSFYLMQRNVHRKNVDYVTRLTVENYIVLDLILT